MMNLIQIYEKLLNAFGPQDWWPIKSDFKPPEFEMCIGAILTQNTAWNNVEKALSCMKRLGLTSPEAILSADIRAIQESINSAGFYRQKSESIIRFSGFFMEHMRDKGSITREMLLDINGIGHETADCMMLYAFGKPYFVVDAYTKRVLSRFGIKPASEKADYENWRSFIEKRLPKDIYIYKELHALIVELAKRCCRVMPLCSGCPLVKECAHGRVMQSRSH
jgi:endonuclease-3 related protein